jgi:hypothetical protein
LRQSELCKLNERRHQVPAAGNVWKKRLADTETNIFALYNDGSRAFSRH